MHRERAIVFCFPSTIPLTEEQFLSDRSVWQEKSILWHRKKAGQGVYSHSDLLPHKLQVLMGANPREAQKQFP